MDTADLEGWTALNCASAKGRTEVVAALIKAKADLDKPNKYGWEPHRWAITNRHTKVADLLQNAGAQCN